MNKRLLQINLCSNILSTGKICEGIGQAAIKQGWDSYVAYGMNNTNPSASKTYKIGGKHYLYLPYLESLLFDNHSLGLTCVSATKKLIEEIERIKPDIIQLHTIHCYYLNLRVLFTYLKMKKTPIVWTFHDCWPFTGHCAYFVMANCNKWETGCYECQLIGDYPRSLFADRTKKNWEMKKFLFTSIGNLTIVPVSDWMKGLVKYSFFKDKKIHRIYNGIDTETFCPSGIKEEVFDYYGIPKGSKVVLGAASSWNQRKGFSDFFELSKILPDNIIIVLVGLSDSQIKKLPINIIGIRRTYDAHQMAELYTAADVFVNPTYADTFPTVNLESLACGTPVITYRTGGSPEAIDEKTGVVVEQGDTESLRDSIVNLLDKWNLEVTSNICRQRALSFYDKTKNFSEYVDLYNILVGGVILWISACGLYITQNVMRVEERRTA